MYLAEREVTRFRTIVIMNSDSARASDNRHLNKVGNESVNYDRQ